MVTTIQVDEQLLLLLKKLKEEYRAQSYREALMTGVSQLLKPKISLAGSLKKHFPKGLSREEILKDLRDKNDRF